MNNNQLSSLPVVPSEPDFETSLTKISMDNNKLVELPGNMDVIMKSLRHLSTKNNRLSSLPDNIGSLLSLTHMYNINNHFLRDNKICDIHFYRNFEKNKITNIPSSFRNLVYVQTL